jgi:hypothetical protein
MTPGGMKVAPWLSGKKLVAGRVHVVSENQWSSQESPPCSRGPELHAFNSRDVPSVPDASAEHPG